MQEMLTRMEARPSMLAIRLIGWMLCHVWSWFFSRIYVNDAQLRELIRLTKQPRRKQSHQSDDNDDNDSDGGIHTSVVLLPTHKSHIDYLLLSWIWYRYNLPMPFIAAGDNLAAIPLVGAFFRRCGAFFIQRGAARHKAPAPADQRIQSKKALYKGGSSPWSSPTRWHCSFRFVDSTVFFRWLCLCFSDRAFSSSCTA